MHKVHTCADNGKVSFWGAILFTIDKAVSYTFQNLCYPGLVGAPGLLHGHTSRSVVLGSDHAGTQVVRGLRPDA